MFQKAAASTWSARPSRSASSKITCGLLPPHSSTISFRLLSAEYLRK